MGVWASVFIFALAVNEQAEPVSSDFIPGLQNLSVEVKMPRLFHWIFLGHGFEAPIRGDFLARVFCSNSLIS